MTLKTRMAAGMITDEECFQDEKSSEPEVYTEEEMEAVEGHIQQYFGPFENVFHEAGFRTSMWTSAWQFAFGERDYFSPWVWAPTG